MYIINLFKTIFGKIKRINYYYFLTNFKPLYIKVFDLFTRLFNARLDKPKFSATMFPNFPSSPKKSCIFCSNFANSISFNEKLSKFVF